MKYKVGQRVRVGGKFGPIMTISSINGDNILLVADNCSFKFHVGDCKLIPYKEVEQLCLFDFD